MKHWATLLTIIFLVNCEHKKNNMTLSEYPRYDGSDLGISTKEGAWQFKVWAPTAEKMQLHLYKDGSGDTPYESLELSSDEGVWKIEIPADYEGSYYSFQATIDGQTMMEVVDPYVKMVGVNGQHGYIGDPNQVRPEGWEEDVSPVLDHPNDIVLYELHVRDFSIHESSGLNSSGKFKAFTETGSKNNYGQSTGIDHLKELGVTHIHLLPSFDFRSIDESIPNNPKYNWGYDPQNYNVPEGSYSTDAADPKARVKEFKELVMALHQNGMRVVMDVVYNHTGYTEESLFNQLVPNYYYRQNAEGGFSDAAACGNEVASERAMVRKFMIESVKYWVEEYHIDGFRFDLMGIHDMETMNLISEELRSIDESIFIYGEGWTAGASPLPDSARALKANTSLLKDIAAFSDDLRDGLKGSVFEDLENGFVSGKDDRKESIKFGIVAAMQHPQLDYEKVNYSNSPWAGNPYQCINYVSCHDNHTLWDKLEISQPNATEAERTEMHKLANTIVLTSQGVPFLHAGTEFLRSKGGEHNSYQSPDSINNILWNQKNENYQVFEYYQKLVALRKAHPAFRMRNTKDIQENLVFMDLESPHLVGYWLNNNANGDSWERIGVVFNGSTKEESFEIPNEKWTVELSNGKFGQSAFSGGQRMVAPKTALIFHN